MFILVCIVLVLFPFETTMGAREGLECAFNTVIPAILPFAVFSSALVYSGIARVAGAILSPLFTRVTGLNPYGAVAFISGMLGGYPVGAKVVCDMINEGLITKEEGEDMLAYSNNGGIVFAINILGGEAFSSVKTGLYIFFASVFSALMAGIILNRKKYTPLNIKREVSEYKKTKPPTMAVLGKSIASGGAVMINIVSSFVVFYGLMAALKMEKLPFFAGLCEVTGGVLYAGEIESVALGALFFAWGGLAVFAQSASVCAGEGVGIKNMVKGKLLSSAIVFFITALFSMGAEGELELPLLIGVSAGIGASVSLIKKLLNEKNPLSGRIRDFR